MSWTMVNPKEIAVAVLFIAAMIAALIATANLLATAVPRWRDSRAARRPNVAWVALACATVGVVLMRLPTPIALMATWLRLPWGIYIAIINGAAASLGLLFLSAVAAHIAWAASGRSIAGLRRRALIATVAAVVPMAIAVGPAYGQALRVTFWQALAPRTPFGVVERIEFRIDGEGTLATWTDKATVTDLVALCPWTDRGLGYATKQTDDSSLHLVFVTESGRTLDLILAATGLPVAEPAWMDHQASWEVPELMARIGELLAEEPGAREYAEQFEDDERRFQAPWVYWQQRAWEWPLAKWMTQ